jgi:hypothetical protein
MRVTSLVVNGVQLKGFDLIQKSVAPAKGTKFAIVRIPVYDDPLPFDNTVMATPVNDEDIPSRYGKGSKIPCRDFFGIVSRIQTPEAFKWAVEPHVLWINDRYYQDSAWPDFDPQGNAPSDGEPIAECIYYPCNFVAYDYKLGDWYHLLSYINTQPPTDSSTNNWVQKPWLWGKAQAISKDGTRITNVGAGLDAYLPLIKRTTNTWMHSSQLETLPELPYLLQDGSIVVEYILMGANVKGVLEDGSQILLRKVGKSTGLEEPYNWHLTTRPVIPPEGF